MRARLPENSATCPLDSVTQAASLDAAHYGRAHRWLRPRRSVSQNPAVPNLDRRFWITHGVAPLLVFIVVAALLATTDIDLQISDTWFFDAAARGFPARNAWWSRDLLHHAGRDVVRLVALGALLTLGASFVGTRRRHWRRPAAYVVTSMLVAVALVGALKTLTNVDCPWDLARYGGTRPFVHLFADRPDELPRAACFPGAHSSSGFALVAFYFLLRGRRPVAARIALAGALFIWGAFSFAQQARGAHFLSHDLWSAFLVWFTCLGFYAFAWRGRVMSDAARPASIQA
jgi:membrane-associated PAP2 superfamily phosphatase